MPKKPSILRTAATHSFALLLTACSGDVVNLGGGSTNLDSAEPAACAGTAGDGNFVVTNQAGLEALRGCEEIHALTILAHGHWEPDLRPLSSLRVVRELLTIMSVTGDSTTSVDSLEGLESLERVGGLSLDGISAPTLEPLRNLSEVVISGDVGGLVQAAGEIRIERASQLRNLAGLENTVGFRNVALADNPELETLDGLQLPSMVNSLGLIDNPKLTNIEAMSHVSGIGGLHIHGTGIERLDAGLLQDTSELSVKDNPALVAITGFNDERSMRSMHIQNNARLRQLPEFTQLLHLDSLIISGNPELQSLPTFPELRSDSLGDAESLNMPMRALKIADNASLQQFVAPPLLREVMSLSIRDNASLSEVDLAGLEALTQLTITNNPSLVSVALDSLQTVNSLEVLDNGQLSTATFTNVQTFTRDLQGNAGDAAQ